MSPLPVLSPRLQSGMNLQICFVNDSGSDKDSDGDDSKTETSLDTPLSPMVGLGAQPGAAEPRGIPEEADPVKMGALNPPEQSFQPSVKCEMLRDG